MADTIVDVPTEDDDKDLARRQWVAIGVDLIH